MAIQPQATASLTRLRNIRASFCQRLVTTETKYLDLGLEYHAFPLQLRRTKGVAQADCAAAFVVRAGTPTPDCLGFLADLRGLCTAARHGLQQQHCEDGAAAAEIALRTGIEMLEALSEQLVAVQTCVDSLHRQFSALMDAEVEFAEGNEYRLAMRPEQGREKHGLLREWVMALPEVREWFRKGAVRCEDEALWLAASAGGAGGGGGPTRLSFGKGLTSIEEDGLKCAEELLAEDEGMGLF
jgi:hypothetical protein